MIIPPERLDQATLNAILEEYITREGTDYGEVELSLEEKLAGLRPQILSGEVKIVLDETSESISLVPSQDIDE